MSRRQSGVVPPHTPNNQILRSQKYKSGNCDICGIHHLVRKEDYYIIEQKGKRQKSRKIRVCWNCQKIFNSPEYKARFGDINE